MLLPGHRHREKKHALVAVSQRDMKGIEGAVNSYYQTYSRYPVSSLATQSSVAANATSFTFGTMATENAPGEAPGCSTRRACP